MERGEGYGGDVVDGEEADSEAGVLDFGFGFDEDVAAGSAAFVAFGAEEDLGWAEVGGKALLVLLAVFLLRAAHGGPS